MKYSIEKILESFDEPGNARAVSVELSTDQKFINTVTFSCEKPDCNCVGGWTTGIGRTVAAQMGDVTYSPPVQRTGSRRRSSALPVRR